MRLSKKVVVNSIKEIENLYKGLLNTNLKKLAEYKQFLIESAEMILHLKNSLLHPSEIIELEKTIQSNRKYMEFPAHDFEVLKDYKRNLRNNLHRFANYLFNIYPVQVFINKESEFVKYIKKDHKIQLYSSLDSLYDEECESVAISILIYPENSVSEQLRAKFDLALSDVQLEQSLGKIELNLKNLDYYTYTRLYLEAKLNPVNNSTDIEMLLAGSSYTVCGLYEKHIPIKSRNIAIDAQDLYYAIKSIKKATAKYKNIKYCVLSFAYYLWGNDISLSTTNEIFRIVQDINYPIFLDSHNYPSNKNNLSTKYQKPETVNPLEKEILDYDYYMSENYTELKLGLEDKDYYRWTRIEGLILESSNQLNELEAQERANSHNKFFKYKKSIKENIDIFEEFIIEMESKGIKLLVYVPPVSSYYRKYINPELIYNYYEIMNPFLNKYEFKFIDLFNSEVFNDSDFYDYDHLNDYGAEKLSDIIVSELNL